MPCPHFDISITKRSEGQSAVAAAAYQSGERLYSERDHRTKDYSRKQGVVYTDILLPENAPPSFADRETLWNAVEKKEGQWNSQLARRIIAVLPREIPPEQYPSLVYDFCQKNFVSKGMCVDLAIHDPDPPGHNPHVHLMLTMRAMDENGKWLPKAHKVYDLDEHGERIRLPSGEWKSHKENIVDWNEQYNAEKWRHSWEVHQNRYLEKNQRPERVDLRSFARQGIDLVPTVHMGPAVSAMEDKGIETDIGNLNRDIRRTNRLLGSLKKSLRSLFNWFSELRKQKKELMDELSKPQNLPLPDLLLFRYNERKLERLKWKNEDSRHESDIRDDEKFHGMIDFMRDNGIRTFDDLAVRLEEDQASFEELRSCIKEVDERLKQINTDRKNMATYRKFLPVYQEYSKKGWKVTKDHFYAKHKTEIDTFRRVKRSLEKSIGDLSAYNGKALVDEYRELEQARMEAADIMEQSKQDISMMKSIRYYVTELIPELSIKKDPDPVQETEKQSDPVQMKEGRPDQTRSSQSEASKKTIHPKEKQEQRVSALGRLSDKKQFVRERDAQKKPKMKKQNMEL